MASPVDKHRRQPQVNQQHLESQAFSTGRGHPAGLMSFQPIFYDVVLMKLVERTLANKKCNKQLLVRDLSKQSSQWLGNRIPISWMMTFYVPGNTTIHDPYSNQVRTRFLKPLHAKNPSEPHLREEVVELLSPTAHQVGVWYQISPKDKRKCEKGSLSGRAKLPVLYPAISRASHKNTHLITYATTV